MSRSPRIESSSGLNRWPLRRIPRGWFTLLCQMNSIPPSSWAEATSQMWESVIFLLADAMPSSNTIRLNTVTTLKTISLNLALWSSQNQRLSLTLIRLKQCRLAVVSSLSQLSLWALTHKSYNPQERLRNLRKWMWRAGSRRLRINWIKTSHRLLWSRGKIMSRLVLALHRVTPPI